MLRLSATVNRYDADVRVGPAKRCLAQSLRRAPASSGPVDATVVGTLATAPDEVVRTTSVLEAVFVGATGSVVDAAVGTADVSSLATGGEADGASVPHPLTTIRKR